MTDDQIKKAVNEYIKCALRRHEVKQTAEHLSSSKDPMESWRQSREAHEQAEEAYTLLGFQLTTGLFDDTTHRLVDGTLGLWGIDVQRDTPEYMTLCREFTKARRIVEQTKKERLLGNYENTYDLSQALLAQTPTLIPVAPTDKGMTYPKLSDAIAEYLDKLCYTVENTPFDEYNGPSLNTIRDEYRPALELFHEYAGDISTDAVTYQLAEGYKATLATIPARRNTKKELKRCANLHDKIEAAKQLNLPSIGVAQREKIFSTFKRFTEWCSYQHRAYMQYNPAEGISAPRAGKKGTSTGKKREAFDNEDINNLVTGLLKEQAQDDHFLQYPERYWIPLIALHSGLRAEEIAQLYTNDIKEQDGIPYFDANWFDDDDKAIGPDGIPVKHLKTAASKRIVPVHSVLVRLGFLDYVEQVRKAGQPRLWMNLGRDSRGKFRRKFSDWFNGADRREGFRKKYISDNPKKPFHSTRHTVTDWFKQRGHAEQAVAELLGHQHPNITFDVYGDPIRTSIKAQYLELMQHDVDFVRRLGHWYDFSGTNADWKPSVNQGRAVKRRRRLPKETENLTR